MLLETFAQAHTPIRTSLAGWLHTPATHCSLDRVKADAGRRTREVRNVTELGGAVVSQWDDIGPCVDEAIASLPEKLRYPIISHFLEGQTHDAIAESLCLSQSSVTRRIQRGIEGIRKGLRRRGLIAAPGALTVALGSGSAASQDVSSPQRLSDGLHRSCRNQQL